MGKGTKKPKIQNPLIWRFYFLYPEEVEDTEGGLGKFRKRGPISGEWAFRGKPGPIDLTIDEIGGPLNVSVSIKSNVVSLKAFFEKNPTGRFKFSLTPPADIQSIGRAGPHMKSKGGKFNDLFEVLLRPLTFEMEIKDGKIIDPVAGSFLPIRNPIPVLPADIPSRPAPAPHGGVLVLEDNKKQTIFIDWRPDWVSKHTTTIGHANRPIPIDRKDAPIEIIDLHIVGGSNDTFKFPAISGGINTMVSDIRSNFKLVDPRESITVKARVDGKISRVQQVKFVKQKRVINGKEQKVKVKVTSNVDVLETKRKKTLNEMAKKKAGTRQSFSQTFFNDEGNEVTETFIKVAVGKINKTGVHYMVDATGHIVKFMEEKDGGQHGGFRSGFSALWGKVRNGFTINTFSIGIEHVVYETDPNFSSDLVNAACDLVSQLKQHFGIESQNIIGHNDSLVQNQAIPLVSKNCPTQKFPFKDFQDKKIILTPVEVEMDIKEIYSGAFKTRNFLDGGSSKKAIEELQVDLRRIGWWCPARKNQIRVATKEVTETIDGKSVTKKVKEIAGALHLGTFDEPTKSAVVKFQIHFMGGTSFTGAEIQSGKIKVDKKTALMIKKITHKKNELLTAKEVLPAKDFDQFKKRHPDYASLNKPR